jgi:hypothetical protein
MWVDDRHGKYQEVILTQARQDFLLLRGGKLHPMVHWIAVLMPREIVKDMMHRILTALVSTVARATNTQGS